MKCPVHGERQASVTERPRPGRRGLYCSRDECRPEGRARRPMTGAAHPHSLKVPAYRNDGASQEPASPPARAGGDQVTVIGRDEPVAGCPSAQPLRLIIPSSRCGGPASREPVLLDRQTERETIDGLLCAAHQR
jgi:hypothetical protein